jgi:hypothetical protein
VTSPDRATAVAYAAAWDFACVVDGEVVLGPHGQPLSGVTAAALSADPAATLAQIQANQKSTRG